MKVKDLIKELRQYSPSAEVIVSKDPEGNGFNALPTPCSCPVKIAGRDDWGGVELSAENPPSNTVDDLKAASAVCLWPS